MVFKISTILALFSISLFASSGGGETDIVERTFNFVIFAAILYYLVAEPIKKFLTGRTLSIESEFKRNEAKLEESKLAKEKAQEGLIVAKRKAGMLVADAKKEAQLIKTRLEENLVNDVQLLDKQQEELMALEESKMVKSVVEEVIGDIVTKSDVGLDQDSLTKTLLKKVS
jgi:F-type H+-transporting ATPase subunit b